MRILIVEDEVMIRVGMGKLIESETKHQIIGEAKNGKEGLELALRLKPDLIITDIRMPEMDGLVMMQKIRENQLKMKAVILTGYAEFEYARQAIHLGVHEYLLKPIGVEDVKEVLGRVEQSLEEEQMSPLGLDTLLRDSYLGSEEDFKQIYLPRLKQESIHREQGKFQLYLGYIGMAPGGYIEEFQDKMSAIKESAAIHNCMIANIDKLQEVLCLVQGDEQELEEFQTAFYRKLLRACRQEQVPAFAVDKFDEIDDLYKEFLKVQELVSYAIVMESTQLFTEERIRLYAAGSKQNQEYLVDLENRIKSSVCNGNIQNCSSDMEAFLAYMREQKILPENCKHGYLRFVSFISNLLQEIDKQSFVKMQNMCFMKQIGDARTREEIEIVLRAIPQFLESTQGKKEDIHNYTIKRAINYIREHYAEGISLDQTAESLDITPEYLSTLFNKEMEINFSAFVTEFRISHAKRLLKGTDMKIYEIADAVGYHDSKYFMRVFKEIQGVSPKEYRSRS